MTEEIGISSILVAKIDTQTFTPAWVNTNMPISWMEEYIQQNYLEVDPLGHKSGKGIRHPNYALGSVDQRFG
ncbi:MAG: hypothetical protein ACU0BB_13640 [Paracoccaceae bacterium]